MLFSERDVDLMRLLCWCQLAPREEVTAIIPESELDELVSAGLVKLNKSKAAYVITAKGMRTLFIVLDGKLPAITQSYHAKSVERRLRLSRLMLTAYKANIEIFTTDSDELQAVPSLFLSTITRGRGGDPWGGTRVGALLHLPDIVAAMHYVAPGIGKISLVDEIAVLANQSAIIKDAARSFIFAGVSYTDVLSELEATGHGKDSKLIPYGEAYRASPYPVFLLPCDDTGAKQLRLMSVPGYRQWFTRATLQSEYKPPPADVPDWDAIFRGAPFVMAADMDLRRIDRAVETAKRQGYSLISMAALEPQAKEVLYPRYVNTGKAKVFVWTQEIEEALFGERLKLWQSKNEPFRNAKGECVNAPLIQTDRKIGRPAGKKTGEVVRPA